MSAIKYETKIKRLRIFAACAEAMADSMESAGESNVSTKGDLAIEVENPVVLIFPTELETHRPTPLAKTVILSIRGDLSIELLDTEDAHAFMAALRGKVNSHE